MTKELLVPLALCALVITNMTCFLLMRHDKRRAQQGGWRVPEAALLLSAACFGALGGVLAMRLLRHKTKHVRFKVLFPLMLIAQIALLIWAACLL